MTDYTYMSDAEINLAVAEKLGYKTETHEQSVFVSARHTVDNVQNVVGIYDPCNNPGDAWPVILENRIAINPAGERRGTRKLYDTWRAGDGRAYHAKHKNPLRAAMIVFLMMKDAE
jgi:hypothetical protein